MCFVLFSYIHLLINVTWFYCDHSGGELVFFSDQVTRFVSATFLLRFKVIVARVRSTSRHSELWHYGSETLWRLSLVSVVSSSPYDCTTSRSASDKYCRLEACHGILCSRLLAHTFAISWLLWLCCLTILIFWGRALHAPLPCLADIAVLEE